ncbi:hypothetical protein QE363_001768 [Sphingomonas sp. SORGH_AS870]|uniref:hypothetical protein n=1 Tax=Sphingomonas sp. SORGH_AS_0870 TaxID=3041801 RepID=UPI0028665F68|nr:hypothetical protein [Sphingomonas sp. SORGH_AS_0870]MDR6145975.1 hypothetical protein [Sphingomonas sp. SORGH_AS_0870]
MKADVEIDRGLQAVTDTKLFAGRFVRKQGQYGTVAVFGYLNADGVDAIADPKRIFPRDGVVETQGLGQHANLNPGDWIEFDIVKNTRFRAPEWKVHHLRRLPRFAVLPETTLPAYRVLLTGEGWAGDARPGLWAFRLSGDMVIVAEMELGKDRRLRVSRSSAREVKCYRFSDDGVVRLGGGAKADDVFLAPADGEMSSFDWSDEADHIARVVRSLAGKSDTRLADIISWLELHKDHETGRVSAASGEKEPALEALRSGALASRLRADRELMEVYLAAALQDDAVKDAVAAYAREGHGAEYDRLRQELAEEIAAEKAKRLDELSIEMDAARAAAVDRIDEGVRIHEQDARQAEHERIEAARRETSTQIELLEKSVEERREQLEIELADESGKLCEAKAAVGAVQAERDGAEAELAAARDRVSETKREIDRLLAIADRLGPVDRSPSGPQSGPRVGGITRVFPVHPKVDAAVKGDLIARQVMLSDNGKDSLRSLLVMLLAGEVPIITGIETTDLLRVAESIVCPGRFVSIEADPTLISLDDLWARPGSGVPTMLAAAAEAARDGGAVLVVIRGIERSGARFWLPALSDALRSGGLPRGLLVCCTVQDEEHDEIVALPDDVPWLRVADSFTPGASSVGPSLLTHPRIDLETLDPGPVLTDLSTANSIVLEVGEAPSLDLAMRAARMFAGARLLLGTDDAAKRIVLNIAKPLAAQSSK